MATINQLTAVDALEAGDQFPIFDSSNSATRSASVSVIAEYMQENLTFGGRPAYITQYSAPDATAFTVIITSGTDSIHLILTPVANYADGAIVLPAASVAEDKQEVLVNVTKDITTLVVTSIGASVIGEPSAITTNDFFLMKYDSVLLTWYRVG